MKAFESEGLWFLPEKPDHKVAGRLTFSPDNGVHVAFTGALSESFGMTDARGYPAVHGFVRESPYGKAFTLHDCFSTKFQMGFTGFVSETILANRAFCGDRFLESQSPTFDSISMHVSGLADWVGTTGMKIDQPRSSSGAFQVSVDWETPDILSAALGEQKVSIGSSCSIKSERNFMEMRERFGFSVSGLGGMTLDDAKTRFIYPLQNLITLATDRPSIVEDLIVCQGKIPGVGSVLQRWTVLFGQVAEQENKPEGRIFPHDMLFTYSDVKEQLGSILTRWLSFHVTERSFCDQYFALRYGKESYIDMRLLKSILTISSYLAKKLGFLFEDTANGYQTTIVSRVGPTEREMVTGMRWALHYSEFPLMLLGVLRENQEFMAPVLPGGIEAFVGDIVRLFREACGMETAVDEMRAVGTAIYWVEERLGLLLKILMLKELGITPSMIGQCLARNQTFQHLSRAREIAQETSS